jgi:hypothetical protein
MIILFAATESRRYILHLKVGCWQELYGWGSNRPACPVWQRRLIMGFSLPTDSGFLWKEKTLKSIFNNLTEKARKILKT